MKNRFFTLLVLSQFTYFAGFCQIDSVSIHQPSLEKGSTTLNDDIFIEDTINIHPNGPPTYTICKGDSIEIRIELKIGRDNYIGPNDYKGNVSGCNPKEGVFSDNGTFRISGIEYSNYKKLDCAINPAEWFYCIVTFKVSPNETTSFRVEWVNRHYYYYDYSCPEIPGNSYSDTRIHNLYGDINVIVKPKPATPSISYKTVTHPWYNDGSKSTELSVTVCKDNEIRWNTSPMDFSAFDSDKVTLIDPFVCKEYRVACEKDGCLSDSSNIVNPAKEFRPSDHGYKQVFREAHLWNQIFSADNLAESVYRKEYSCILSASIGQIWGEGIVKSSFDYVAKNNPCNKSIQKEGNDWFFWSFASIGSYHLEKEVVPSITQYISKQSNCTSLDKITSDHESFLINAVSLCFDQVSANLDRVDKLILNASKIYTLALVRALRENLIRIKKYSLRCIEYPTPIINLNHFPPPLAKQDLFIEELNNIGSLRVYGVPDTSYFLKAGSNLQLIVLKENNDGTFIDITKGISGTTYILSVDSSVAYISSDGLLHLKAINAPFTNTRTPIVVQVKNSMDFGYGQFAIYDDDSDNDFISNSAEVNLGMNPLVFDDIYKDSDGDQLEDFQEAVYQTSISNPDTDSDGFSDFIEVNYGSDPKDPNSYPVTIHSVKSGSWDNEQTWSCNCIPTQNDPVTIKVEHNVSVPASYSASAQAITIGGNLEFKDGATFYLPNR